MLLLAPAPAGAEPSDMELLAEDVGLEEFEHTLADLDQLLGYDDQFSLISLWEDYREGRPVELFKELGRAFRAMLGGELRHSSALLAQLLLLSLLSVLLALLRDNLGGQTGELSRWVVYLLLLALAVLAFDTALTGARETVANLSHLLLAVLPPLLILLAAVGAASASALLSPLLLTGVEVMGQLMSQVVFPLIYFSAVLRLVGHIASRFKVSRLADLFRDFAVGLMAVLTTVFVALLSVLGLASASTAGVAVKMAKSAASAFIPVVGRTLAEVLDSVLSTSLVLKNAIGVAGVAAVLLICAIPACKLLLQSLIFRIAGALVQPLGDDDLSQALYGMGKSLTLLFAALAICGVFAFFGVALLISLGDITMMMR